MSNAQPNRLLAQLRHVALHALAEPRTDGQLLEHFIGQRDEVAFETLLRRHGPMVRSVCRRVIGNADDADDAFQATFLVLVRKAASVRPREAVGNWLYGVAYRTALEARGRLARRRAKEKPLHNVPPPQLEPRECLRELWPILDRELSRLSDKYRWPLVLCDLEGRSRKEVARQLAIPEGTLSSRLATARKKLATRLARYGFAVGGVALAALLTENTASASLPASLLMTTTKAALLTAASPLAVAGVVSTTVATLTEGVLKTMLIAKIKTVTLVLCGVAALGLGTGGVYYQARAGGGDAPKSKPNAPQPFAKPARAADAEAEKWQRIAEELQLKEKKLQLELAKLRDELAVLRQKAQSQQEADQLRLAAEKKAKSGKKEQPVFGAGEKPKPGANNKNTPFDPLFRSPQTDVKAALAALEAEREELLLYHADQQKAMEAKLREQLNRLDKKKAELLRLADETPPNKKVPSKEGGDKLDRILERLDRMEKRLDRLERGRK